LPKGQWFRKFCSDYLDVSNDMLYPFGYGLSYTTYSYSNLTLSAGKMDRNGSIQASVKVTNTGDRDGCEIVQMYLHQLVGSVARPVKELKGFQRVPLKAGESKRVVFTITPDMLRYYNNDLQSVLESGKFDVMVGPNSEDLQSCSFTLE
jgi:beta-glucosidase